MRYALAPETSPDGMMYHLGLPNLYLQAHGIVRITTTFYATLSQGMEMLFLFAFAFGRHSAAASVHYLFFPQFVVYVLRGTLLLRVPGT